MEVNKYCKNIYSRLKFLASHIVNCVKCLASFSRSTVCKFRYYLDVSLLITSLHLLSLNIFLIICFHNKVEWQTKFPDNFLSLVVLRTNIVKPHLGLGGSKDHMKNHLYNQLGYSRKRQAVTSWCTKGSSYKIVL